MLEFNPVQTNQRSVREKLAERLWEVVRPVTFVCSPWFARKWRVLWLRFAAKWYSRAMSISSNCSIARTARVDYPWNFSIGDHSSICGRAWVYCLDKISIGANCCIGEDVKLITGSHDISSTTFDLVTKQITIGDNVWIATGAYILPGVSIGDGAVVAAGAIVTKDVEPWTVVGGNPARELRKRWLADKMI